MSGTGIITQARMTSTRLPGKVLLTVNGVTMLERHVRRLEAASLPIVVATTVNASDDPIVQEAERLGVGVFRGSEADVLSRFARAAQQFDFDSVVRVTSDCPLIDGDLVREGVDRFVEVADPHAFVSNTLERSYPRGFDFEVFSLQALLEADENATAEPQREHVTPYIYGSHNASRAIYQLRHKVDASSYRVTLDTAEDLELIDRLITDHGADELGVDGVIDVLSHNPSLVALNRHIEQKKIV